MKKAKQKFSAEFKAKVAIEAIKEVKTISELAQIDQVHPNLIKLWKKEFLSNAGRVFDAGKDGAEQIKKPQKGKEDYFGQTRPPISELRRPEISDESRPLFQRST